MSRRGRSPRGRRSRFGSLSRSLSLSLSPSPSLLPLLQARRRCPSFSLAIRTHRATRSRRTFSVVAFVLLAILTVAAIFFFFLRPAA